MSSRTHRISVLKGDGVGPEVVDATLKVLDAVQKVENVRLEYVMGEAGFNCIEKYGTNLPPQTVELIRKTEACLKGPMTTPEEPGSPRSVAVTLRSIFDLYANMRPARTLPNVPSLKPGIDMVIVRENTEGLYSGKEFEVTPGVGVAMRIITKTASERVARFALDLAMKRRKRLTFVHKGNILKITDGIFKGAVHEMAKKFPDVELEDLHIDIATAQLIKRPESFDVIVTTNLFGDILSDEAAQVVGGLGMAPAANIGDNFALFEPVHGAAFDIAGKQAANPSSFILSAKMMFEWLGMKNG